MESCQPTQVGPCRGIKGQLVCTLTLTRSTSYSTSSLDAGHSSHGPPSPRTPYNTHPWPHVSSVVAFFVSFGPRGEGTNPFKTSGPEGSREENATNPTTAGLPTGSGVVQAPPTSLHIRGFGAPEGKAIFARAIRAPCRGSRGKPRQDSNPGQDRSQATGAGFHMCPCSGWVTPSTDLVDAITRSSGLR